DLVRAAAVARPDRRVAHLGVAGDGDHVQVAADVGAAAGVGNDDHASHGAVVGELQTRIVGGTGGGAGAGAEDCEGCDDWLHGISQEEVNTDESTRVVPSGCRYEAGAWVIASQDRTAQPQCRRANAGTVLAARPTPFAALDASRCSEAAHPIRERM